MENIIFVIISVHLIYFIFWFFTNKIKNSHLQIVREWDNGYEFYETLNPIDKEKYWKEDTKIKTISFVFFSFSWKLCFIVFIEIGLLYGFYH